MAEQYTYAVARIRAMENSLLKKTDLEQLLSCKSYGEALRFLADKGYGSAEGEDYNEILNGETEKTWAVIDELGVDKDALSVLLIKKDFHNLKGAIKAVCTGADTRNLYMRGGNVPPEEIEKAVSEKNYSRLPESMRSAASEAMTVLLQTGDGQKCDVIIDKAALCAIRDKGRESDCRMISDYAEITVAISDIKIAVRGSALGKTYEFMKGAMAECDSLDTGALSAAAAKSREDIEQYLAVTAYSGAAEALKVSYSEFEKWCDNLIMDKISEQKSNPFTIAPVAAYILARENEINAVRIILSGKVNNLSDEFIRERLRELYV